MELAIVLLAFYFPIQHVLKNRDVGGGQLFLAVFMTDHIACAFYKILSQQLFAKFTTTFFNSHFFYFGEITNYFIAFRAFMWAASELGWET